MISPIISIPGYLLDLPGFSPRFLRWCSLHTVNLGAMVWIGAGALEMLMTKARFEAYRAKGLGLVVKLT